MARPNITLTVTLEDFTGTDVANGALVIRLCGFGQILPHIAGTAMLARITQEFKLASGVSAGILLYGTDQISPANTFYAISILDDKKNIVQSGIYQFFGTQTIDLSNAPQLGTQPLPGLPNLLVAGTDPTYPTKITGAFPGNTYVLPKTPFFPFLIALYYNAGWLRPQIDYTLTGTTIHLNFNTQNGDNIYAVYIASV